MRVGTSERIGAVFHAGKDHPHACGDKHLLAFVYSSY